MTTPPGEEDRVTCPWCGADDVTQIAPYGSLLMTARWSCDACGTPFERVRHRQPHGGVARGEDPAAS